MENIKGKWEATDPSTGRKLLKYEFGDKVCEYYNYESGRRFSGHYSVSGDIIQFDFGWAAKFTLSGNNLEITHIQNGSYVNKFAFKRI